MTFLSLYIGQGAFCAEFSVAPNEGPTTSTGVDVREFKKIKSIFKKNNQENPQELIQEQTQEQIEEVQPVQKEAKMVETELDTSTFSIFEDEEIIPTSNDDIPIVVKKKENKFLNFFKKKKKKSDAIPNADDFIQQEVNQDELPQEDIFEGSEESEAIKPTPDETYINDTEVVYIKEIEM